MVVTDKMIKLLGEGDADVYKVIYNNFSGSLYAYVDSIMHSRVDSEDIFLKFFIISLRGLREQNT